jgi:hypothetical protein
MIKEKLCDKISCMLLCPVTYASKSSYKTANATGHRKIKFLLSSKPIQDPQVPHLQPRELDGKPISHHIQNQIHASDSW